MLEHRKSQSRHFLKWLRIHKSWRLQNTKCSCLCFVFHQATKFPLLNKNAEHDRTSAQEYSAATSHASTNQCSSLHIPHCLLNRQPLPVEQCNHVRYHTRNRARCINTQLQAWSWRSMSPSSVCADTGSHLSIEFWIPSNLFNTKLSVTKGNWSQQDWCHLQSKERNDHILVFDSKIIQRLGFLPMHYACGVSLSFFQQVRNLKFQENLSVNAFESIFTPRRRTKGSLLLKVSLLSKGLPLGYFQTLQLARHA